MTSETKHGMGCAQFDALLNDALDGVLSGAQAEAFQQHRASCEVCGQMFAQVEAGMNWLHTLEAVEPPAALLDRILEATSGVPLQKTFVVAPRKTLADKLAARVPWLAPVSNTVLQPRFAMSFAMAFFSLSAVMNVTGMRLGGLRHADLRPTALVRTYQEATGRVVRYYENLRFVYEIESRVRELKRDAAPITAPAPKKNQPEKDQNNTSGDPERKQNENYSRDEAQPVLAAAPDPHPGRATADPTFRRLA